MVNNDIKRIIDSIDACLRLNGVTHCNKCLHCRKDSDCRLALKKDILALLKAKEPKPPIVKENSYGWKFYYCPSCGKDFYQNNKFNFCEKCGQAVKWV